MLAPRAKLWPAKPSVADQALEFVDADASKTVVDIGCGNGVALFAAARRGCRGFGVEIVEERALAAIEEVKAEGLEDRIRIVIGNALEIDEGELPSRAVVYLYLIARGLKLVLPMLRKLAARQEGDQVTPSGTLRVVTLLYAIPGLKPVKTGLAGTGTPMYLYHITADSGLAESASEVGGEGEEEKEGGTDAPTVTAEMQILPTATAETAAASTAEQ
jgi:hypothetical protein